MNKEISINDIYIGLERKDEYSEFLEEYELWEEHVLLEKTNFGLNLEELDINVYRNTSNDEKIYINNNGFVLESKDEIINGERYHKIVNLISLKDLLKKFETENRKDCQYRRYITPIYEKVYNILNNKSTISFDQLNKIFGNINDIHSYIFELITEDEYEELFGCKTYDFATGYRIRK